MDFWASCYAYIETCRCFEFQRLGSCHCLGKKGAFKGTNPCQRNQDVMDDILALSMGDKPPYNHGPREIAEYIRRYTCSSYKKTHCNHPKCNQATHLLEWLYRLERKAA